MVALKLHGNLTEVPQVSDLGVVDIIQYIQVLCKPYTYLGC